MRVAIIIGNLNTDLTSVNTLELSPAEKVATWIFMGLARLKTIYIQTICYPYGGFLFFLLS